MKATSSATGAGSRSRSSRGVSVVPRIALPIQGTTNNTLPSAVFGTSRACEPGENSRSTTTCTPWLGATMGARRGDPGSRSMSRTASTLTPVALITQRARSANDSPLSASRAMTPRTRPSSRRNDVTSQWLSTTAPRVNAVRASATARRASSNRPSQYFAPPASPCRGTPAAVRARARTTGTRCGRCRPRRPARRTS